MKSLLYGLVLGAALLCGNRADACKIIDAPQRVGAGARFNFTVQASGPAQLPATVVRVNLNDTESEVFGTINDLAPHTVLVSSTNYVGPHTIRMKLANGGTCEATVIFEYLNPHPSCVRAILAIGQSDELGWGYGPFNDPLQNTSTDSLILQVNAAGTKLVPVGYTDQNGVMWDGLQHVNKYEGRTGMGHVLTLARNILRYNMPSGCYVVIIPAAEGSTTIQDWDAYDQKLYMNAIARTQFALAQATDSQLIAVVWQQGTSDAVNWSNSHGTTMSPSAYQAALISFFAQLRSDLSYSGPIIGGCFTQTYKLDPQIKLDFCAAIENAFAASGGAEVSMDGTRTDYDIGQPMNQHMNAYSQVQLFGPRAYAAWSMGTAMARWKKLPKPHKASLVLH